VSRNHRSLKEKVWDRRLVSRLARDLASLAAKELTRTGGAVRDPEFLPHIKRLVRGGFASADVVPVVSEVVKSSLHLCHPRFSAQQVAAPVPVAALVESVVAALNNSVAVWDMSPAATVIDREVMNLFKRLFGFPSGAEGSSVAGGAYANLTAFLAARAKLAPHAWRRGQAHIAILAGAQTHYSVSRAAGILGLGADSVFTIPTDALHRTDPTATRVVFHAARKAGFRKFILVATSGSTPTGSCDDLHALAKIARREGAWLHVDAAHGGGLIFSRRHRRLLRGIDRADSISFDPHKMLFMPLCASVVLVRDGRYLRNAFEQSAPYLFGGGKREFPDIGQFTIACSQRFDALKTWLTWKAYSGALWDELISSACDVAHAAYEYCLRSRLLEPAHEPQTNIFCFGLRERPRSLKASDRLHWAIKDAVNASGEAYISSTVLGGRRLLRMVVMNPRTTANDIIGVLKVVERVARRVK
jgi:L-2,4-diaminobutyrate decarboxylase